MAATSHKGFSSPDATGMVTIHDVAAAAQVSPSTVSRVMNNRPVVAEATRRRVLAAIDALHFRPSALGRNLATRRTGLLGLVVADITNPFYPEVVRGVEQAAAAHDMSVLLYDTAEDSNREAQALRLLGEQHVDGIIICASRLPEDRIVALAHSDTPLALINRSATAVAAATVDIDQEAGVRDALDHLVALGHRRIAYIGGPAASQDEQRRLTAFRAALMARAIAVPDSYILTASPTIAGGKEAAHRLLTDHDRSAGRVPARPTAVLAYNDQVAMGVITAARQRGVDVPGELSVVGRDDIPLAEMIHPALTTVRQPMRTLGEQAVHLLFAHIQKRAGPAPSALQLTPTLVVRASTAPPIDASRERKGEAAVEQIG